MKIDIITIFPNIFDSYFDESIIKRAREKNIVEINIINLRNFTTDKRKTVDDTPFGGGEGMVMMVEPIEKAVNSIKTQDSHVIALSAKGELFKQSKAKTLSQKKHLILICGRYEGFDQRILDEIADEVLSIGNFVLTGGEIPAMIVADSVARLIPGVLGNESSPETDSYFSDDKTKQYPIYTKPAEYKSQNGKTLKVPDILLSGNHEEIKQWREKNSKT